MEIKKNLAGDTLTIELIGRLDAVTSSQLERELNSSLDGVKNLILDFSQLKYIASADLRVLLVTQKRMKKQGKMTLRKVSEDVRDVLDMTGFINFLQIEE